MNSLLLLFLMSYSSCLAAPVGETYALSTNCDVDGADKFRLTSGNGILFEETGLETTADTSKIPESRLGRVADAAPTYSDGAGSDLPDIHHSTEKSSDESTKNAAVTAGNGTLVQSEERLQEVNSELDAKCRSRVSCNGNGVADRLIISANQESNETGFQTTGDSPKIPESIRAHVTDLVPTSSVGSGSGLQDHHTADKPSEESTTNDVGTTTTAVVILNTDSGNAYDESSTDEVTTGNYPESYTGTTTTELPIEITTEIAPVRPIG